MMRVLVTGARGFIARNLIDRLQKLPEIEVMTFCHEDPVDALNERVCQADAVVHLAGVNRPLDTQEFTLGNVDLTQQLINGLRAASKRVPVIYASSTQAALDNPYGRSKAQAEQLLFDFARQAGCNVFVFRLPNVFGKWSRPNYNSAVATFCHNVARGLPLTIHDPAAEVTLTYVDDVVDEFIKVLLQPFAIAPGTFASIPVVYRLTVGSLAELITGFRDRRSSLLAGPVGQGLVRALYATYLSFLPPESFSYSVPRYESDRGVFVEMLRTSEGGQLAFFSVHPGATRGGHYHHIKNEKFLIVHGTGRFGFRHVITGERFELVLSAEESRIVETVPGWAHDITNIGTDEMVVMLWANEVLNLQWPDTYPSEV